LNSDLPQQARDYIDRWGMESHPEGGYYNRVYESELTVPESALPDRFSDPRQAGSVIYYLLTENQPSRFHRLAADEMWHFYDGSPVTIHCLAEGDGYRRKRLGPPTDPSVDPQSLIPHGTWFAAEVPSDYALVGCTVWPEFRFDDYREGVASQLTETFPAHEELIDRLTD
jgi:predicted cupin superfamily sugar epimerase